MSGHPWRAPRAAAAVAAVALVLAACGDERAGGERKLGAPEPAPGFDGRTIKLGVLTPLSGPVAVTGLPITAGNEVYFAAVNARGGIAGKYRVKLVEEDTRYVPDVAVQKYNKLKDDVAAFAQILGTPPTLAVLQQLRRDGIIASPASGDATWVREPNLLPLGAPYQVHAVNGLDYYVKHGGGKDKTICSIVQDDAYGDAGEAGVDLAAGSLRFEVATRQRFRLGDNDMTGQVQRLRRSDCDAVFIAAGPADAGTIWATAAKLGFKPRWIAQAPVWIDELASSPLSAYLAETTWIVFEGTEWGDRSVPGMRRLLADIKAHRPAQEPDYYFSFGYNQARAMTALLEQAVELGDLSREGLLRASAELGTVSFGGLLGDYRYGPADKRQPPRQSTIFAVDPSKPVGLARVEYQYESPIAAEIEFGDERD